MNRFFFITTYDTISGSLIASLLNEHKDINCHVGCCDPFLDKNKKSTKTLDYLIENEQEGSKLLSGNAQYFSAYELQNKILSEKTRYPLRVAHLALDPKLRINLLLNAWLAQFGTPENAIKQLEKKLQWLYKKNDGLYRLYRFDYFHNHLVEYAIATQIDLTDASSRLFLIALAKVLAYDSADLPVPGKVFLFENLIQDMHETINFIHYLSNHTLEINDAYQFTLSEKLAQYNDLIQQYHLEWHAWQSDLFDKYVELRLETIYFPHIDKPLAHFYRQLGYSVGASTLPFYSKLISIQLNSNRPAQLVTYFDNIEETADNPNDIEVLVNIDEDSHVMKETLIREAGTRSFTIKYVTSERPQSFCDLWKPINKLLKITDPHAYFLLNISDEMLFATRGWDTILKKYVGFFPDHLFRLRASRNKFRNYFDRWECSFAQDAIPITTKRWVDIGGDWNPCFGPDSFQQLIVFYLAKEGAFGSEHCLRELPIIDIAFHGDVPALGIDQKKLWRHNRDHLIAMQICQSYPMQLEAKRRALLLKAHMLAAAEQIKYYDVLDVPAKKQIHLLDKETDTVLQKFDYSLSWFNITLTNQLRKLRLNAYFGGGKAARKNIILSSAGYLKTRYYPFQLLYLFLRRIRNIFKKLFTKSPIWTVDKLRDKLGLLAKSAE